ncbi:hypothetical protein BDN72DRAFT_823451 [Pluteus cervinus]|uniref:Uncharacterized protein n=1 Tax=Pluteus cervinus TaxID=181527 RepID=A0ACD3ALL2_9AGAR|nr:hypothetical protein BDN72DRAFT_823451 [Pluteus cervinus]
MPGAAVSSSISALSKRQQQLLAILRSSLPRVPALRLFQHHAPTVAKYLVCLLFLLNWRSWPFVWHFRIFRPVFVIRLSYRWMKLRTLFSSRTIQAIEEDRWGDALAPIGENPIAMVVPYNTSATMDDCDFNLHLSNSSYAKTLDGARFKAALLMFPHFFRAGGWMPLAVTHYHFIHEIPIFAKYEVRTSVAAWDQKWLYLICKFVTKKDPKKSKKPNQAGSLPPASGESFAASVRIPADEVSSTVTPLTNGSPNGSTEVDTQAALQAVTAELFPNDGDDENVTLHTVSVSQLCFKVGRLTVPPAVALACNGFSIPPPAGEAPYSRERPPPHWPQAKLIMSVPAGGSTKKLRQLMQGGWKDVPEDKRFWDKALGGVIEDRRKRNLVLLEAMRTGLSHARTM